MFLRLTDLLYILFAFALGSCVGSFLNVVVWRLPRGESLVTPPSHCPKCERPLKWYDNLPIIGWIKLGGKCRFCREPISIRYPIVEAVTGVLFAGYYAIFFLTDLGPCVPQTLPDGLVRFLHVPLSIEEHWPIYALDMLLVSGLLAVSLIDAESFHIPIEIPWLIAAFALLAHAVWDRPGWPAALNASAPAAALAAGAALGLLASFGLWSAGILPTSFAEGLPMLEVDRAKLENQIKQARQKGEQPPPSEREFSKKEIRAEVRKEMLFLLPPLAIGLAWVALVLRNQTCARFWEACVAHDWLSGLLGSILGLLVGGFIVWLTRILGTIGFGREAMGMGDVHLMAGVGAVIGPGAATVAFFLAPFFGLALAVYMLLSGKRRELPYGPYLSLATGFVLIFYCPIAENLSPGVSGLMQMISGWLRP